MYVYREISALKQGNYSVKTYYNYCVMMKFRVNWCTYSMSRRILYVSRVNQYVSHFVRQESTQCACFVSTKLAR